MAGLETAVAFGAVGDEFMFELILKLSFMIWVFTFVMLIDTVLGDVVVPADSSIGFWIEFVLRCCGSYERES